jgi:multiple sugar transport system substrate-binding protein
MEKKRLLRIVFALILSTSFILSSCVKNNVDTNPTMDTSPTSKPSSTSAPSLSPTTTPRPTAIPRQTTEPVLNFPNEPLVIWSWNENLNEIIKIYAENHPDFIYDYHGNHGGTYSYALDSALSSGDGAPDLYSLEPGFSTNYVNSSSALDIAELGIDYAELHNQFPYTYELMTSESGQIKALSYQACPGVIFYNRTLAYQYLGVFEPDDVQPYFADWDTFLSTARQIASDSDGSVRLISGTDDIYLSFSQQRTQPWVVDGNIEIEQIMLDLLDYSKLLKDDELTFDTEQWTDAWTANKLNESVLAYFGPLWFAHNTMGFNYEDDAKTVAEGANPSTGEWACVAAPTPFFWGGTFLAASPYNREKELTGDILRYLTIDTESMRRLLSTNQGQPSIDSQKQYELFPNNIELCSSLAADNTIGFPYLGGQNPYPILLTTALKIVTIQAFPFERECDDYFLSTLKKYKNGEYASVKEATQAYIDECNKIGIGVE